MSSNLAELTGIDVPTRLLIGGEWTSGRGGGTMPVIDPATEDALTEVADGTVEDALDAVGAAQDALAGWAATRRSWRWPRWCRGRWPRPTRWPRGGSTAR